MVNSGDKPHEDARAEFERSMNDLERSLEAPDEEAPLPSIEKSAQPTAEPAQAEPSQSEQGAFDLAALEEAAADIEAFMRDRDRQA